MRKTVVLVVALALLLGAGAARAEFTANRMITVISREDGSGTRGAFIELFGIEVKGPEGTKKDMTTKEATIVSKTDVMLQSVAGDQYAVGYVSLGSLNDSVRALNVDGAQASAENVKNGSYRIARPFSIATRGEPGALAQDFINFILSREGQDVVGHSYIRVIDQAKPYAELGNQPAGKLVIAGSSSVTPIMEKLAEAYRELNVGATIEIQMSDSTAGMTGAIEGTCDIGMASRALKDSEKEQLTETQIALDGIAVIVNPKNPLADVTSEQVRDVFTGQVEQWSGLN